MSIINGEGNRQRKTGEGKSKTLRVKVRNQISAGFVLRLRHAREVRGNEF